MQKIMLFPIIFAILFFFSPHVIFAGSVALTFDDGPSPVTTPRILDILDEYQVRATFFVTGLNSERFPEIVREAVRRGHEIGNHTFCHFDLVKADHWALEWQISAAQNAIAIIIGLRPKIFRPPFSRINETIRNMLKSQGLRVIMWDVSPEDYKKRAPQEIVDCILSQIKPGSIVVMHDYRWNTVLALPEILEGLRKRHLQAVTVSELRRQYALKK